VTGPVQVLVIGFDEPSFSGGVMGELTRLREAGVVRLVDVLLVRRDDEGTFHTLPAPVGSDADLGQVVASLLDGGEGDGDAGDEQPGELGGVWSLHDLVEPGAVAAVALLEHLWAGPLVDAIGAAGGHTLGEAWLAPEDRATLPTD
jgi:hypothetical protein